MLGIGLLVLRLGVGLTLAGHGSQKLFGWFQGPHLEGFGAMLEKMGLRPGRPWATLAGLAEFVGGICIALGLFTPIAALVVAGNLVVAIVLVHLAKGFWNQKGGYEFPLSLALAGVALSLTGAGPISADSYLQLNLREPATWWITFAVVAVGTVVALAIPRLRSQPKPELG